MHTREIEYIAVVSELGHFSKAAEKLNVSQPALSQAIRRLEDRLGVALLNRASSPIALTDAGRLFMKQGYEILFARDSIYRQMAEVKNMTSGTLSIGISQFIGKYYISRHVPLFNKAYPGIRVQITEEISSLLEEQILQGKIEFGIYSSPAINPKLHYDTVFEEELLFATSKQHPVAKRYKQKDQTAFPSVDLSVFKNDDFIMVKEGQGLHSIGMDLCRKSEFEPNTVFASRNIEAVNACIANGMGVGFVPASVQRHCLPEHTAAYFHLKGERPTRRFMAAYLENGFLSKAAKAYIALAKECS